MKSRLREGVGCWVSGVGVISSLHPNATKLRSKALIGKGSRGSRGSKRDRREINSCKTKDFKIISPPAPSSPPAPPALKEFSAYLRAIRLRAR